MANRERAGGEEGEDFAGLGSHCVQLEEQNNDVKQNTVKVINTNTPPGKPPEHLRL